MPREYLRQLDVNQRIIYSFDETALARANIFVDDGFLELTTTIDGATDKSIIPAGRSWSSGQQQRFGITSIELAAIPNRAVPTVTYDIGPDAGDPNVFTAGGVTPVERSSLTDHSDDTNNANRPQNLMDLNNTRRYLYIQNNDGATDLWINFIGAAVVDGIGSVRLGPYDQFSAEGSAIPASAISVISSKAGHKFTAYEG